MPVADWLPYPPPLYINIGFGPRLRLQNSKMIRNVPFSAADSKQQKYPYYILKALVLNWQPVKMDSQTIRVLVMLHAIGTVMIHSKSVHDWTMTIFILTVKYIMAVK